MKLLQAFLDIHSSCNYKCSYCFRNIDSSSMNNSGAMPLAVFEKICTNLKEHCWSVSLSCAGEPLLHPQFPAIISLANSYLNKLDVAIVTNGFLLSQDKQDILADSCLSRIAVSVDTVNPALYKKICGCSDNALNTVIKNIDSLAQKLRARKDSPKLFITAIAMKSTLPFLPELAQRFSDIGVYGIKIQWLTPYTKANQDEVVTFDNSTHVILQKVESILKHQHVHFEYPNVATIKKITSIAQGMKSYKNKKDYLLFSLAKIFASKKKHTCRIAGTYLQVLHDGTMYVCPQLEGMTILGNENAKMQKELLRKAIMQNKNAPDYEDCLGCRFLSDNVNNRTTLS